MRISLASVFLATAFFATAFLTGTIGTAMAFAGAFFADAFFATRLAAEPVRDTLFAGGLFLAGDFRDLRDVLAAVFFAGAFLLGFLEVIFLGMVLSCQMSGIYARQTVYGIPERCP
jgi:hypothetical protein